MITNDRQFKKSGVEMIKLKALRQRLERRLTRADNPTQKTLQIDRLKKEIDQLGLELEEYRYLRADFACFPELLSCQSLPLNLIRARVALGWSQKELADRCRLKPQQIQRYEKTLYASAKLSRVLEISQSLCQAIKERMDRKSSANQG